MTLQKPNFFIAGAARSGTTTLWACLKEHPRVFLPPGMMEKEPAYFSSLKKSRFNTPDKYHALFNAAGGEHRWVGEASTAYLTDPKCAGKIYEYNPEARIVIILRNPVHRAYSLYNWMSREGFEYAATFEEALELESARAAKTIPNYYEPEYYYNFMYYSSGLYHEQVRRYIELFGERVCFLVFEDLIRDIDAVFASVCRFLQVAPGPCRITPQNPSLAVPAPVEQFLLRKITIFLLRGRHKQGGEEPGRKHLRKVVMEELYHHLRELSKVTRVGRFHRLKISSRLKRLLDMLHGGEIILDRSSKENRDILLTYGRKRSKPPAINPATAARLLEKYRDDIAALSGITGLDLSHWLGK